MKTTTTILLALSLLVPSTFAQAQQNGADGFFLGAGGGALIGQAIGRNTEATLIGTAVGGMLGYILGNEVDKAGVETRVTYTRPQPRHTSRTRYVEVVPPTQPDPICRETEMLAEIDGRAEKVYGTACLQNGEWVISEPQLISQTIIIEKNRRHTAKRSAYYKRANFRNHRFDRFSDRNRRYRPIW